MDVKDRNHELVDPVNCRQLNQLGSALFDGAANHEWQHPLVGDVPGCRYEAISERAANPIHIIRGHANGFLNKFWRVDEAVRHVGSNRL